MKNKRYTVIFVIITFIAASISLADDTEPPWVYKGRGDRYMREGRIGDAITQYKKALIAKKEAGTGPASYPEVHYKLAEIYLNEGLYEIALQHINMAENEQEFLQIPGVLYDILYLKANILFHMNHIADSIAVYERIIKDDINWEYYTKEKLSTIPDTVLSEILDNQELKSTFGEAYFRIGEIKYKNHNFITAEPYLKMAFLYGYDENTQKLLASCYKNLGMTAQIKRLEALRRR